MEDLERYCQQAARFKARRTQLAHKYTDLDKESDQEEERIKQKYHAMLAAEETIRRSSEKGIWDRYTANEEMNGLRRKGLNKYAAFLRDEFGLAFPVGYVAQPVQTEPEQIEEQLQKLRETGGFALAKRTFRLSGYGPRKEMGQQLYRTILDALAYCDLRRDQFQQQRERSLDEVKLAYIRRTKSIQKEFDTELERHRTEAQQKKQTTKKQLCECTTSPELLSFRSELMYQKERARQACHSWGNFVPPSAVPNQILMGQITFPLIDAHGIDQEEEVPLWFSFRRSNLIVITSEKNTVFTAHEYIDPAKKLVCQLLARMLQTVRSDRCRFSIFDTLLKGGSLGRLIELSNIGTNDLAMDIYGSEKDCEVRRQHLCDQIQVIRQMLEGKCDLYAYDQEDQRTPIPYNWIIDFNFPEKISDKYREDLRVLLTNASHCGFSFILVASKKSMEQLRVIAKEAHVQNLVHIDCTAGSCMDRYAFKAYPEPTLEQLDNYVNAIAEYYKKSGLVDNSITTYYQRHRPVLRDAAEGIKLPIAIDSRGDPVELELGTSRDVHAFVTGATNSGKSTLLHTVVMSACLLYHPDDLELWLVDYKQVEFAAYRAVTPPHVKLIGLSKTQEFTFSLLETLQKEFLRRSLIFTKFNVRNLKEYRKHSGEPGYVVLPRILLVVDEFHEMSQFVEKSGPHKEILENMLKEYRALGLTCFFADQTINGLHGLTPEAKLQIGSRLAMNNLSEGEIRDTLMADASLYSEGVKKMIHLMNTGDFLMRRAVYVGDKITDVSLDKFRGLLCKSNDIESCSQALIQMYKGRYIPKQLIYICSKESMPWSERDKYEIDALEPIRPRSMRLYLGHAATLRPCFAVDLSKQPNENLAIVGGSAEQRWAILWAAINSMRYQADAEVVVFLAIDSDLEVVCMDQIKEICDQVPNVTLVMTTEQWCSTLLKLERILDTKTQVRHTLCVFIGLEIMQQEMENLMMRPKDKPISSYGGFSSSAFSKESPEMEYDGFNAMPIIEKLFTAGSRLGIRSITEVSVNRQFQQLRWLSATSKHRIAFSMSEEDALFFLGNTGHARRLGNFALYYNGSDSPEQLIPYKL